MKVAVAKMKAVDADSAANSDWKIKGLKGKGGAECFAFSFKSRNESDGGTAILPFHSDIAIQKQRRKNDDSLAAEDGNQESIKAINYLVI